MDPILARLQKIGVRRPVADFREGNVRLTFVKDPDGIWVEFLSWAERGRKLRKSAPVINWILPNFDKK